MFSEAGFIILCALILQKQVVMAYDGPVNEGELWRAFNKFGAQNGLITAEGMHSLMNELGKAVSLEDVQNLINEFVTDGSGQMNFEQFLNLWSKATEEDEDTKLRDLFKKFTDEGNDVMTAASLISGLRQHGVEVPDDYAESMIEDVSDTGTVTFEQFKTLLPEIKPYLFLRR